MLQPQTPFPHVGSYALLVDTDTPTPADVELVRIQWRRESEIVVSFPLRDGASGTKRVDPAQLIDASPLTTAEAREFKELDRALFGRSLRTPKQKRDKARRDALHLRIIYGPVLDRQLRFVHAGTIRRQAA